MYIDNKAKVIQERKALNPLNMEDNDDATSNQEEESKGSDKK
jgi:hypothetical protein